MGEAFALSEIVSPTAGILYAEANTVVQEAFASSEMPDNNIALSRTGREEVIIFALGIDMAITGKSMHNLSFFFSHCQSYDSLGW